MALMGRLVAIRSRFVRLAFWCGLPEASVCRTNARKVAWPMAQISRCLSLDASVLRGTKGALQKIHDPCRHRSSHRRVEASDVGRRRLRKQHPSRSREGGVEAEDRGPKSSTDKPSSLLPARRSPETIDLGPDGTPVANISRRGPPDFRAMAPQGPEADSEDAWPSRSPAHVPARLHLASANVRDSRINCPRVGRARRC
jgi:hypothetical protein